MEIDLKPPILTPKQAERFVWHALLYVKYGVLGPEAAALNSAAHEATVNDLQLAWERAVRAVPR